jgi:hypothetical protein
MRALVILVAAAMLGLAGGYAWSGMTPAKARAVAIPRPKFDTAEVSTPRPSELDDEWAARADGNRNTENSTSEQNKAAVEQQAN